MLKFLINPRTALSRATLLLAPLAALQVTAADCFAPLDLRAVQVGGEIGYDGEDREWLLGLAQEAESSIDAMAAYCAR